MNVGATLRLGGEALLRNKMRSLLTTLGVVIGVAAVVIMQAMGAGATALVQSEISSLGSNMLVVMPGGRSRQPFGGSLLGAPQFSRADATAIDRECPAVSHVAISNTRGVQAVVGERNRSTILFGVTPEYFEIRAWPIAKGRQLDDDDEHQGYKTCVIGHTIVADLFGGREAVGEELRIHDLTCRVVGVLEAKGTSSFGIDQDDVVYMPASTFSRRIAGHDQIGLIMLSAVSESRTDEARVQVEELMRQRRRIRSGEDDDFSVRDLREVQNLMGTVTGVLTSLLAGVAAISLLVGGIGIMNIMLVSVTERTREIGIRLAIGAHKSDIMQQFLVEAVTLSTFGGAIGLLLGIGGAAIGSAALHVPFTVPPLVPLLAFGFSVVVGIAFGVWPARKAARLRPIEALRFE